MSAISDEEILDNKEENDEFEDELGAENMEDVTVATPKEKKPEPEKKLKPHEQIKPDYTKGFLPSQEETGDQAPLVVVVQGSKNVGFFADISFLIFSFRFLLVWEVDSHKIFG